MSLAAGNIVDFPLVERSSADSALAGLYVDFARSRQGEPDWLCSLRGQAFAALREGGLPTPKLERWKYTNLGRALKLDGLACGPAAMEIGGNAAFVSPLQASLNLSWLQTLLCAPVAADYGLAALGLLNTAFVQDGLAVDVPASSGNAAPLEIGLTGREGAFTSPLIVVRLGRGAALTLIERQTGQGLYWKNTAFRIVLEDGARLRHYRLQGDSEQGIHTTSATVTLGRDAVYESFTLTTGGALSRNQVHAVLNGPGGQCRLNGIMLQRGQQVADTTMLVEHVAPHCASSQFLRSVIDGQAKGVFQGKVHVHQAAQKTDGYQLANTLLLSEGAEMDTKPELEIYADDVKCSHGATTGRLDEEPLFYMRSRGIPEAEARALLIQSFLAEALDKIGDPGLHAEFGERVRSWLG